MIKIGIDLGGTKIEGIALSHTGEELFCHRIATPRGNYIAILQTITELVDLIEKTTGETGTVGICTPGSLSPANGLMRNSNSICMNGKAVFADLQEILKREIRIANDANCFALSEATDGAARHAGVVFGVIIGTGTGAGIVINKNILSGANAIAGEWGHNPLPWPQAEELPGGKCYCGKRGCIETWLSGPGMTRDHAWHNHTFSNSETLVMQASTGDKTAELTLQRYENRMARSLAQVINILDPDAIVLGGGMGNIQRLYKNVPQLWEDYIFSDSVTTRLLAPAYGDSSGVRGAAWLWNNKYPFQ